MSTKNPSKNKGMFNFLTSIIKKVHPLESESESEKIRKLSILSASITLLWAEIDQLNQSIDLLMKTVDCQNEVLSNICKVQEFLLKSINNNMEAELKLTDSNKTKREKPN